MTFTDEPLKALILSPLLLSAGWMLYAFAVGIAGEDGHNDIVASLEHWSDRKRRWVRWITYIVPLPVPLALSAASVLVWFADYA